MKGRRKGKKWVLTAVLLAAALWGTILPARASDPGAGSISEEGQEDAAKEEVLEQFDFSGIDGSLEELFPEEKLDFKETLMEILSGDMTLSAFQAVTDWVGGGIEDLTDFMGVFCPIYFLAVAAAKGSVTAVAFYNLVLFLIYLAQLLIVGFLLPVIHIYFMVRVLDFLSKEEYLSKFAGLIKMGISWTLKTLLACVVGLNVIQGLISPAIDSIKQSAITRGAEAIHGIGDAIGGVTEVVLGTAVLIKNGIGMTGAVICIALCVGPLVQIGCIVIMYKLAAALIQPVSDKRIVGCVESVGDGCRLLMRVVFTTALLFLLTIVIVAALTDL